MVVLLLTYCLRLTVKNPPAMQETWVPFLGWEDPLEEAMATHSGIPPGESPRSEEPGRLQSMGLKRVGHDWVTKHILVLLNTAHPPIMIWEQSNTSNHLWRSMGEYRLSSKYSGFRPQLLNPAKHVAWGKCPYLSIFISSPTKWELL